MTIERTQLSSLQRTCQYSSCGKAFTPNTHNQKYCDAECCRVATNERVMQTYYERKAIKSGKIRRTCSNRACEVRLSIYNFGDRCSVHERIQPTYNKGLVEDFS